MRREKKNRETLKLQSANWLLCQCGDSNEKPASFSFHFHQLESIVNNPFEKPLGLGGVQCGEAPLPVLTGFLFVGIISVSGET